jgi:hypothetical protein
LFRILIGIEFLFFRKETKWAAKPRKEKQQAFYFFFTFFLFFLLPNALLVCLHLVAGERKTGSAKVKS